MCHLNKFGDRHNGGYPCTFFFLEFAPKQLYREKKRHIRVRCADSGLSLLVSKGGQCRWGWGFCFFRSVTNNKQLFLRYFVNTHFRRCFLIATDHSSSVFSVLTTCVRIHIHRNKVPLELWWAGAALYPCATLHRCFGRSMKKSEISKNQLAKYVFIVV